MRMPRLSNELIIEAQIDKRFVYRCLFFPHRDAGTLPSFVMASRAGCLEQNGNSEV